LQAQLDKEKQAFLEMRERDGLKGDPVVLDTANRLFGQDGFPFRKSFLELTKNRYAAPFQPTDFAANPERAAAKINSWVEAQTHRRIRDLIAPDALTRLTRLVLVNAIYLNAKWSTPFDGKLTQPQPFKLGDGTAVSVDTMHSQQHIGYKRQKSFAAVSIGYAFYDLQLLVLLPDRPDGLPRLERSLTPAMLAGFAKLPPALGNLSIPKLRMEPPTLSLAKNLQSLGMTHAFDIPPRSANFDGIAPADGPNALYISDVLHKAFIAVDEKGTEAAAATAVIMELRGVPRVEKPIEVRIDRPFLLAVQHVPTGACLFLGRVNDPR